jgi:hypothetical protein
VHSTIFEISFGIRVKNYSAKTTVHYTDLQTITDINVYLFVTVSHIYNILLQETIYYYVTLNPQLGYRLDDQGLTVQFLSRARNFFVLHNIQTGSEVHPASYTVGTGSFFQVAEQQGCEADH